MHKNWNTSILQFAAISKFSIWDSMPMGTMVLRNVFPGVQPFSFPAQRDSHAFLYLIRKPQNAAPICLPGITIWLAISCSDWTLKRYMEEWQEGAGSLPNYKTCPAASRFWLSPGSSGAFFLYSGQSFLNWKTESFHIQVNSFLGQARSCLYSFCTCWATHLLTF